MAKDLSEFSDEELERELNQRERQQSKPTQLPHPDWSVVKTNAEEYLEYLVEHGRADEDADHYIFESVMDALYGSDIWQFINSF
jgi:anti-sigma regulatory factor (Ser/Thr protein kinase)